MNIFFVDNDPIIAAQSLCDKHISKMILESGQMLCSALRRYDIGDDDMPLTLTSGKPWRGGFPHHPCTVWAGDTRDNYLWLAKHALTLCSEFNIRFGKPHGCMPAIIHFASMSQHINEGPLTKFARAVSASNYPDLGDTTQWPDTVMAYREFYRRDKINFAKWQRGSPAPSWWTV